MRMHVMRVTLCGAVALVLTMFSGSALIMARGEETRESSVAAQLERGRYLVKIAGCNDCHTQDYASKAGAVSESQWLTGSDVGWEGPWGTTYAPNLRLVAQRLTGDEWLIHARRKTRPPMPWFLLREMTDEDLTAIYRFVRWLGPAGSPAPAYEPPGGRSPATPVKRWRAE